MTVLDLVTVSAFTMNYRRHLHTMGAVRALCGLIDMPGSEDDFFLYAEQLDTTTICENYLFFFEIAYINRRASQMNDSKARFRDYVLSKFVPNLDAFNLRELLIIVSRIRIDTGYIGTGTETGCSLSCSVEDARNVAYAIHNCLLEEDDVNDCYDLVLECFHWLYNSPNYHENHSLAMESLMNALTSVADCITVESIDDAGPGPGSGSDISFEENEIRDDILALAMDTMQLS